MFYGYTALGKTTHIGAGWADNDDSGFPATGIEFAPARVAGTQRLARPLMTAASDSQSSATVCRERSVPFGKYWRSSP